MIALYLLLAAALGFVLGIKTMWYVVLKNTSENMPAPDRWECVDYLMTRYGLKLEVNSGEDATCLVKKGREVLFMSEVGNLDEDVLDYFGRLPEDFCRYYRGRVRLK